MLRIAVEGDYPFSGDVNIQLRTRGEAEFALYPRIPAWATGAQVRLPGGEIIQPEPGAFLELRRVWRDGDTIALNFPMKPRVTEWYHQSAAVELGPLLMALCPDDNTGGDETDSSWPWNMALALDEARWPRLSELDTGSPGALSLPRVTAYAAPVPDWRVTGGDAPPPPIGPRVDGADIRPVALKPYGFTRRRVAQFPRARLR